MRRQNDKLPLNSTQASLGILEVEALNDLDGDARQSQPAYHKHPEPSMQIIRAEYEVDMVHRTLLG